MNHDRTAEFLDWLIAMDDPESADGLETRRTVTLSQIIDRARDVKRHRELCAEYERLKAEGADRRADAAARIAAHRCHA